MNQLSVIKDITPRFHNTETRSKEPLVTQEPGKVKMYTCGPTIYNRAHIGNFRTYVFEDLLRRTLKLFGYDVTQVMNLTDVDDKTIRGAIQEGVSLDAFTTPFKEAFFADIKTLGIEPVEHYPAATEYIDQMIAMIQDLVEKGYAYTGKDGSVYYAINKFDRYGSLSHLKLDDLQAGASERVEADEYDKDHVSDFALWKAYDAERDGQIYWESPWGKGRPGWHLECSAMAMGLLGDTLDIHVGGVDNIFPHHENEIAQSEACSGKRFAKLWMHAEHLIVENRKMSKSLGNFFCLQDLLDRGYTGREVRMMLMQTHYRTQLNFTFEELDAVRATLRRLDSFVWRLLDIPADHKGGHEIELLIDSTLQRFARGLADDLNISVALSVLFDLVREVNALCDADQLGGEEARQILELLHTLNQVLGIIEFERKEEELPEEVMDAMHRREQARKNRNWALSDELRDLIQNLGFEVEDTPAGQRVTKG